MKSMKKLMIALMAASMVINTGTVVFAGNPEPGIMPYLNFTSLENDTRYKADSTTIPYLSICKLLITYDNGAEEGGTGFLISPTKVATAAHCLNYKSKTAVSIEVMFGVTGTNAKHTQKFYRKINCTSENTIVSPEWNGINSDYDYGLIVLPKAVETGHYFDLYNMENPDSTPASIVGYEHTDLYTKFYNYTLIKGDGTIHSSNSHILTTRIGAMPGQSGSPVLDSSGRVIGMFTYGAGTKGDDVLPEPKDTDWNEAIRFTEDVIDFYNQF